MLFPAFALGKPLVLLTRSVFTTRHDSIVWPRLKDLWEPNFKDALQGLLDPTILFRTFPFLTIPFEKTPFLIKFFSEHARVMLHESSERIPARIKKAQEDFENGTKDQNPSLFTSLLKSSLPDEEKTIRRLGGEGFSMTTAGTETTAVSHRKKTCTYYSWAPNQTFTRQWTLTIVTFHLLDQPKILDRLKKELENANALGMSWFELEKLPYLNAVVTEAIRHTLGLSARSPRIAPDETLIYRGTFRGREIQYTIPCGTPMGMSTVITNNNEDVFPEPYAFIPERWLDIDENRRRRMENNITSFSKGSRQCVGMKWVNLPILYVYAKVNSLAYCNIYLAIAHLSLRVIPRMTLFETTLDDVKYDHDGFTPRPKKNSKGVRVIVS